MRGGHNRRRRPGAALTSDTRGSLRRQRVPRPPEGLTDSERALWLELARQVDAVGIYTAASYSSFRLLVKSMSLVEGAANLPATAAARLLQTASQQLSAFGLSPLGADRLGVHVQEEADNSPLAEFVTPIPLREIAARRFSKSA